ncbi:phage tail terminator protein, partial [Serratia marcescens]|uniref:phage tail terminator protein n=6 Tax=Enterobacterales TaxID=91347 RepID=UPI001940C887
MVTDYLFCEPLLIGRLRDAVPEFVEVTGVAGLSQMNDDNPVCPMAYVMYLGDTVNTSTAATGGSQRRLQFVTQLWAVVVCVYFADGRGLGADISSEAGPLMLKTVKA